MASSFRYLVGAIMGAALGCTPGISTHSLAEQSSPLQPPLQRDDPATSGAGPTSGAPGLYNYDPPKEGSTTTDARGVTTTQPKSSSPKSNATPRDLGNDSINTTPSK
jgi:hypothetical protein